MAAASTAAAGSVRRTLRALDFAVSLAITEFTDSKLDPLSVYNWLVRHARNDEQLHALNLLSFVDSTGIIRRSRNPTALGLNVSDRDYFRLHLEKSNRTMVIGAPTVSRTLPHRRAIPTSWALRERDGQLVGVIVVAESWRLYAQVFAALLTRPEQTVALVDTSGRLYALDVHHWRNTDEDPLHPAFLDEARKAPQPRQMITAQNVIARADVTGPDLQVIASEPIATVLTPWWQRVYVAMVVIAVISISIGFLTMLCHRNLHALRETAAEARAAQARAEQGEQAKAQFLAAMSHEIRTPMTGVLGMADLLAAEPLNPRQHGYVRAIRTSGQHLLHVINDILNFSRLDAGGFVLEQVDFSVGEVLEEVRSIMTPQAVERRLSLSFDLDEHSPPVVRGDPTRLRQVLVNLVGNGLKFTSQGGVYVAIRCRIVDEWNC